MALTFGSAVSLKGPQGSPGSQIYFGSGTPDANLGVAGDVFFASDSNLLYQKTASGWPADGTLLRGAMGLTGIDGASFISGVGAPTMDANDGDLYLDLGAGEIFKREAGAWADQGHTLKGPQGEQGQQGMRGSQIYVGHGAPDIANYPGAGLNDLYFDQDTGNMYAITGS